ncbi:urease accessory protein UreD [Massilia horti]|uniref:Urease accessory protein UreD n=1 Tax=Massilia horti TaxID=2562153 RepID=A0A4Y9SVS6_9BURK|nr:urease accessory protein UreD [Massilia horti]TFW30528.1 urease accessory protein UreD [Massilia horti]TFW30553.1 urease accessory protein UreD [Massilia horti]
MLELEFAELDGATRVVRQFQQLPLYIFHPLYVDPGRPGMAFIYMLQSGEGIVQGDRYRLDLNCAPGTAVHFTTQAATKIFHMEDNFATQIVNLTVGAGAFVEYLPDPVIPFRDSRFYQRLHLTIAPDASGILGEILLPGRVARDEVLEYALYYTDLEARTPDGRLLFADRLKLARDSAFPGSPGLLGSYGVFASLYVVTRTCAAKALVDRLHDCVAALPEVLAGASELPNGCGASVRLLGQTSAAVGAAMHRLWNEARLSLLGLPAPDLRKH